MTKSLAQEIASRNITVNCIAPGFIESAMTDKLNDKQKETIMSSIPMKRMETVLKLPRPHFFLRQMKQPMSLGKPFTSTAAWQ